MENLLQWYSGRAPARGLQFDSFGFSFFCSVWTLNAYLFLSDKTRHEDNQKKRSKRKKRDWQSLVRKNRWSLPVIDYTVFRRWGGSRERCTLAALSPDLSIVLIQLSAAWFLQVLYSLKWYWELRVIAAWVFCFVVWPSGSKLSTATSGIRVYYR